MMCAVRRQEPNDSIFPPLSTNPLVSARKSRSGEVAFAVKHPPSGGNHTQDHKSGSFRRETSLTPSLDSFNDAESSTIDLFSSSSISSARRRPIREDFPVPKVHVLVIASDRIAARNVACNTSADSYAIDASNVVFKLTVRSKLPKREGGVNQSIRGPSGAVYRDRNSGPFGWRLHAPAFE